MADDFANYAVGMESPAPHAVAIVASDAVDLARTTRAIYVGGGGDIKVITAAGETVTFSAAPAGLVLPIRVARVLATGTTATNLIGMF